MNDYKRISTPQSRAPQRTEYDDALATMGMRIRKAVAEGYSVSSNNTPSGFNRQPLPSHIDQPPSLTNMGSTMDSSSNLSEWEHMKTHQPQLHTISSPSNKRKFDDEEYQEEYVHPQYGQLKFNEDF